MPAQLAEFITLQKDFHQERKSKLKQGWREYLHTEIQSKLKETGKLKEDQIFKFFSADINDYEGGYL